MSLQFIIDGYNIINHPKFRALAKSAQDQRNSLLKLIKLKNLTGSPKNKVSVIFDGYPPPDGLDEAENFNVIFSRVITADEKIKMMVEESAYRKSIAVVSDDKQIQLVIRSLGAKSVGVEEFIEPKKRANAGKGDFIEPQLSYSEAKKINDELKKLWLG